MTDTEKEQQAVESTDVDSWGELLGLKREVAENIIHKMQDKNLGILSVVFEDYIVDYLVNEGTLADYLNDEFVLWNAWKVVGIVNPTLKRYREMLSEAETKTDLNELETKIFNEISWIDQSVSTSESSSQWQSWSSEATRSSTFWRAETSWKSSSVSKATSSSSWATRMTKEGNSNESTEKARVVSGKSYEIDRFDITVSPEVKKIWENMKWKEKPDLEPYACAMKAYEIEKAAGNIKNTKYVTVVDFTKNQLTQNRFFVINLENNTVEYAEKCWHWVNSGGMEWTTSFSNRRWSLQSSLWAFITANHSISNNKRTWTWNFWTPLEESNSNLRSRGCAIHPVWSLIYRSWRPTSEWCFTIPRSQRYVNEILHEIEWWSLVFAYAKSRDYFAKSDYFQQKSDGSVVA